MLVSGRVYHLESRWRNSHVLVYHGPLLTHLVRVAPSTFTTWRIILVSKWLVTPIYKPFRPFVRGITLLRGLTITMVINYLLTGMILQVGRICSNISAGLRPELLQVTRLRRECPDERCGCLGGSFRKREDSLQGLGGGFKYFLFSTPFGEDSHFD